MFLFKNKLNNIEAVTKLLVEKLNVSVTETTIKECLGNHPDYPSLMALSDCLTDWYIANEARRIPKENYKDYEIPFIAQLMPNGGSFILINSINQGQINYSDEKHLNASMPEDEFLKKWSGSVLRAEANENSTEPGYKNKRLLEIFSTAKLPILVLIITISILMAVNFQSITLGYGLVLLSKLTGIAVSILLLTHSIDANNPLVQNLCSLGNKNNCNAILKSNAAKITKWLSWSEVGFFYFTGSFLCLLLKPVSFALIGWLSALALPYTFYSIAYQYKHKNWCVLCCIVQVLLLFENLIALNFGLWSFSFAAYISPSFLFTLLICFFLPIIIWSLLKPLFLKTSQFKLLSQQLKNFKYNNELFNQALLNQPRYAVNNDLMPVVLGNPQAQTIITMVSNPFCGPCGNTHEILEEWLKTRDDLQLKIIFTTADHDNDEKTKVARHISALTKLNDTALVERALSDWYTQTVKKYEHWAKKYPVHFDHEIDVVIQKQKDWCEMAEISFTPTILVNGYKLPVPYRLEDIKYLIA
ncbi:thioredoxin domain-containing protein [Pedobacter sp. P26]|uniref:thioredoxin domain-containing protein n=1 Tax=Pedobacter sp. P26 TaxID=3423956 RepID=UPI003D66D6E9